jgi:hypothetical protein
MAPAINELIETGLAMSFSIFSDKYKIFRPQTGRMECSGQRKLLIFAESAMLRIGLGACLTSFISNFFLSSNILVGLIIWGRLD